MKRILVLAEGPTEAGFLRSMVQPYLLERGTALSVTLTTTRRNKAGGHHKGGIVRYAPVRDDLRRLLQDSNAALVTTMIDYYRLPDDFPGMARRPPRANCYQHVEHLEQALADDIADRRFLPYLSLHEFEALLFVAPERWVLPLFDSPEALEGLKAVRGKVQSPEEIDDGPETAPSKRILQVLPRFSKSSDGPAAARETGLELMRQECPHFARWLTRLEQV